MKAFIIGAPMTGSGKTTVTIGLLAAFQSRGLKVQPFKVGPDFIDPGLHELATGVPSHNLDSWMLSPETNRNLFGAAVQTSDVAVVEGMMGLFDGFDGKSNSGSTAEMAGLLDVPIILVVDANSLARSVAAIVHGMRTFDPSLRFAGVIFNRVAGPGHYRILEDAVKDVPVLGWLPSNPQIEIRERHLGLLTGQERETKERIGRIGQFIETHLDIERLLDCIPSIRLPDTALTVQHGTRDVKVALAHDPAFSFYYHANRMALEQAGADIIPFSPLRDRLLPEADVLYIGGGYPELYRRELEANASMRESVRRFAESGKRVYAECGGLMYLSRSIDGCAMAGVLPTDVLMTDRPVDFGYTEVTTIQPSILGPSGTRIRGHQFHYSKCEPPSSDPVYNVIQGTRDYREGFRLANGVASYVHLHFLSNPAVVCSVLEFERHG